MPKITVEIGWDRPDDPFWLNPDNVSIALQAYCKNTRFIVRSCWDPKLMDAMRLALSELGVPGPGHPAPVAYAVDILRDALGEHLEA